MRMAERLTLPSRTRICGVFFLHCECWTNKAYFIMSHWQLEQSGRRPQFKWANRCDFAGMLLDVTDDIAMRVLITLAYHVILWLPQQCEYICMAVMWRHHWCSAHLAGNQLWPAVWPTWSMRRYAKNTLHADAERSDIDRDWLAGAHILVWSMWHTRHHTIRHIETTVYRLATGDFSGRRHWFTALLKPTKC